MSKPLEIKAFLDSTGVGRGARSAEHSLDRLHKNAEKSMGGVQRAAGTAGLAIGSALAVGVGIGTRELLEMEKALGRTESVLKSTGGSAGVTKAEVEGLAESLERATGTADEMVVSAENVLLTFTNIHKETFPRATAAANDMAVALGKEMPAAAKMIGRALQDPIKGTAILTRVGAGLDDATKKQIESLVKHGKVAEAQGIILDRLETKFQGAASSEGKTTEALQQSQRAMENATEQLSTAMIPAMQALATVVGAVSGFMARHTTTAKVLFVALGALTGVLLAYSAASKIAVVAQKAMAAAQWLVNAAMSANPILLVVVAVAALAAGLIYAYRHSEKFRAIVKGALNAVKGAAQAVLDFFRGHWKTIVTLLFAPFLLLVPKMLSLGGQMGKALVDGMISLVKRTAGGIKDAIMDAIKGIDLTPGFDVPGVSWLDVGGHIPGPKGTPVPIVAHAGEVVLNPTQQRIIGIDRIMETLRRTGGVVGGRSFDAGGIVGGAASAAFLAQARAAKYSQARRGEPGYMDCSEFATGYAKTLGYTGPVTWTGGAWAASSPASGNEPVVFGFRGMSRPAAKQHMGIRVDGTWYDFGGSGLETGDSNWDSLRVPIGVPTDTRTASTGTAKAKAKVTPKKALTTALSRVLGLSDVGANRVAGATLAAGTGDPQPRGTSLSPAESRSVAARGRAAGLAAGAEGAAAAREKAEREATFRILANRKAAILKTIAKLQIRMRELWNEMTAAGRSHRGTRAQRQAIITAARRARARVRTDIEVWKTAVRAVDEELAEMGYTEATTIPAEEGGAPPEETASAAESDPNAEAAIEQAEARAARAEAAQRGSETFIRALRGSGSIDPAAGTTTIYVAGSLVQESQVASWIVDALGRQPGGSTSVRMSPA